MYFKHKTAISFLICLALGIAGTILSQCDFDYGGLFYNIIEMLKIGLLLAFYIVAVRCMASKSKDQIIKSIFPTILLAIIISILSSIMLGLVSYSSWNGFIEDVLFALKISMATFCAIMPGFDDYGLLVIPHWLVYLALLSCAVMFVREKNIKHFPILGYILITIIAGVPFFLLHKVISEAVAAAMYIGYISNM